MPDAHEGGSLLKFITVAFFIPVLYAVANGGFRRLTSGEKKAENIYVGLDLTIAAFVTVGLYALEPQTRILPLQRWESADFVTFKNGYGLGIALGLDTFFLVWSLCIHSDYLMYCSKVIGPSKWHKFCTGFLNLFWNNFLGLSAFALSAFFLRG